NGGVPHASTLHTLFEDENVIPVSSAVSRTQACVPDRSAKPLRYGFPAERYAGGAGVARGYLNRSDLTAEQYIPDPFSGEPGSRLCRTGGHTSPSPIPRTTPGTTMAW